MIDLENLIAQANELDPLPASATRLAQIVGRSNCSLQDVTDLISFDQALTVKLLRSANSAVAAGVLPVATIEDAVTRIGTAQVLALAVACGAKPLLQERVPAYGLGEGMLWRHSVAAAVAAELIPSFCRIEVPPETFAAALLHDVGKLVMGRFLKPEILAFIQRAQQDGLEPLEAESLMLGVHHGELGGLIAQHWQLPERIIRGITHHHYPEQEPDEIGYLVFFSNQVAKYIEAGLDNRPRELEISQPVADRLHLTQASFDRLCHQAISRFNLVSRRYNSI